MPANEQNQALTAPLRPSMEIPADARPPLRGWLVTLVVLVLAFVRPLFDLATFSLNSSLFSHIILIPFVSGYLIWMDRSRFGASRSRDIVATAFPFLAGVTLLGVFWVGRASGTEFVHETALALTVLSFIAFVIAATAFWLGRATVRTFAFPLAFLVFMAPFPPAVVESIETFLQHGSASVAALMFRAAGTPLLRSDLIFQLPGITLEVAPECSGIRSSLALFITSLVAGQLFLRSPWKRLLLCAAVIPLALIRNGFRVFTIGELCVHIDPEMIHSFIHRQGGPIFFALSLVPFGLLLYLLMKRERAGRAAAMVSSS